MSSFLAVLAAFFLALQGSLMAGVYRKFDRLSIVCFRGLSLGLSMFPLLYFVPQTAFTLAKPSFPQLVGAALITACANTCSAESYKRLAVGFASALGFSSAAVFGVLIDIFYFKNSIRIDQLLLIAGIVVTLLVLSRSGKETVLVREGRMGVGISFSLIFGAFIAVAFAIVGELSIASHPFLVGYCWEFMIGLCAGGLAMFRRVVFRGEGVAKIQRETFLKILLFARPTAVGTGLYLTALTSGPLSIVMAVLSIAMIFSMLFGWILYQERFSFRQIQLMCLITAFVGMLHLRSSVP
ncbi:MAG: DMT family transporter [Bdellovibrionales bacterium]|nr:DMT family transporter [Bdellovibrionales bacterium]